MVRAVLKRAHRMLRSPGSTPLLARLAAVAAFSITALGANTASAANIAIDMTGVKQDPSNHPQNLNPFYISQADCSGGAKLTFPVSIMNRPSSAQFEVWAGSTCDQAMSRTSTSTTVVCKKLTASVPDINNGGNVVIASADIANAVPGVASCVDSGSQTAGTKITLYFMLITNENTENVDATNVASFTTTVDLLGPTAPTGVTIKAGGEVLILDYTLPTDSDINAFYAYCDSGGAVVTPDGGADGGDAGTMMSGGAPVCVGDAGACSGGSVLTAGQIPSTKYQVGNAGNKSSTEVVASGLTDGTCYECGVAAIDTLGNAGPLSTVLCSTPEPINDFYQLYVDAGGQAGGGFCSFSDPEQTAPLFAVSTGILGFALAARRRRRRSQKGEGGKK